MGAKKKVARQTVGQRIARALFQYSDTHLRARRLVMEFVANGPKEGEPGWSEQPMAEFIDRQLKRKPPPPSRRTSRRAK